MGTECADYFGFLQQAVRLAGLGYHYYRLTEYPLKKRVRWADIDAKILGRYPAIGLSKYQRARRKASGLLNAQFFRFDRWALLAISDGRDDCGIRSEESPADIRTAPLKFSPTPNLAFQVGLLDGRFTASIERECFRSLVAYYREAGAKSEKEIVRAEFRGLDRACPSWRGIYAQKTAIRKIILDSARRSGRKFEASDFPVSRLKRSVRVFSR